MSTTTNTGLMPTKTEAIEAAKALGGLTIGMIAAHNISNVIKKQKPVVQNSLNGAMVIGGAFGFVKAKSSLLKYISLGAAAFGAFKLIAVATNSVAMPGKTEGINGLLPDSVKNSIRKFLPTFAGIEEVSGLGDVNKVSEEEKLIMGLSLEDAGKDMPGEDDSPGVGSAIDMAA